MFDDLWVLLQLGAAWFWWRIDGWDGVAVVWVVVAVGIVLWALAGAIYDRHQARKSRPQPPLPMVDAIEQGQYHHGDDEQEVRAQ